MTIVLAAVFGPQSIHGARACLSSNVANADAGIIPTMSISSSQFQFPNFTLVQDRSRRECKTGIHR